MAVWLLNALNHFMNLAFIRVVVIVLAFKDPGPIEFRALLGFSHDSANAGFLQYAVVQ